MKDLIRVCLIGAGRIARIHTDHLKKHLFQGHELDKQTMMKELGDVAWYLAEACEGLGVHLSDVMQMNLDKLHRRYPDGFSTDRSRCRQEDDQA